VKAEQIINKAFNGQKNVLTPTVLCYDQIGNYAFELSMGKFMDTKMFGVSIAYRNSSNNSCTPEYDYSKCLYSEQEALDYIKELKKKLNSTT
jgi:hypothetical protein